MPLRYGVAMLRLLALALFFLAGPALAAPGVWQVSRGGAELTIYGSIHALPKGMAPLPANAAARFDAADDLIIETVIPDDPMALAPTVARLGARPGLKPLAQRVSPAAAARLVPMLSGSGLPVTALDGLTSWLAAITLSEVTLASVGIDPKQGVEPALMARARAAQKPIVGIETPEQQLGFLAALPEADQNAMLEAVLSDSADIKTETDKLLALWQAADIDTIAADFNKEAKATPTLQRVLLTDRNRRWADWLEGVMARPGKHFLAVGTAHLGGPEGLLALLAARGLPARKLPD